MKKIIATITITVVMTMGLVSQAFALNEAPESAPLQDKIRLEMLMDLYQTKTEKRGYSVNSQSIEHFSGDGRNVYLWHITVTNPSREVKSGMVILDYSNMNACIKAIQDAS